HRAHRLQHRLRVSACRAETVEVVHLAGVAAGEPLLKAGEAVGLGRRRDAAEGEPSRLCFLLQALLDRVAGHWSIVIGHWSPSSIVLGNPTAVAGDQRPVTSAIAPWPRSPSFPG